MLSNLRTSLACCVAALALMAAGCKAFEHPMGNEHPTSADTGPTLEQVAVYVETVVQAESAKTGGTFLVTVDGNQELSGLTLDHVHRERLAKIADNKYFICADFRNAAGTVYDLDMWVLNSESGLSMADVTLHKENGVARYTWAEENGLWVKKPVEATAAGTAPASSSEQPAKPKKKKRKPRQAAATQPAAGGEAQPAGGNAEGTAPAPAAPEHPEHPEHPEQGGH